MSLVSIRLSRCVRAGRSGASANARAEATSKARSLTTVGREGVEPSSLGVKARCSAD